jgi:uncharacterized membrane protein YkgB
MSAISIGIVQVRSARERVVAIEDLGKAIVRWGVVIILAWIGGMKFTAYEAMGIQPLVAHSPLLSWMYDLLSVRSFSTMLGFLEVGTAVLIALRSVSPTASAIGSLLALGCSRPHFPCSSRLPPGSQVWDSLRCRQCRGSSC